MDKSSPFLRKSIDLFKTKMDKQKNAPGDKKTSRGGNFDFYVESGPYWDSLGKVAKRSHLQGIIAPGQKCRSWRVVYRGIF